MGLILFAEAAIFVLALLVSAEIEPDYGIHGDTLSRLGVLPATAFLFNGTLVALGLLNFAAALVVKGGGLNRLAALVFVAAGIGIAGAGIVNANVARLPHAILAGVGFLGYLLMPFVITRTARGAMRLVSYLAAASSIAFLVVWIVALLSQPGTFSEGSMGTVQRLVVYPLALWMMVFGGYLVGSRSVARRFARPTS